MVNSRLAQLPEYPFPRLRELIADITPPSHLDPISMSIGEPKHAFPEFIRPVLDEHRQLYTGYPPAKGTPELRTAIKDWLDRRYQLPQSMLDIDAHIAPVCGTREALFNLAIMVMDPDKPSNNGEKPLALIPNPFYQAYAAGVTGAGGEPVYLPALKENNFLPDFDAVDAATYERVQLVYLCSPANPQGAVASKAYLENLIKLARKYDFVIAIDECYAEIYTQTAPLGVLEVCRDLGGDLSNVLSLHSLSKRSNVPGLRSGFMVGDPDLINLFLKLKEFGGPVLPGPVQVASATLWDEESHVEENRRLYREKFDMAEAILGNRFEFFRPEAGFFLWLNVGNGEAAARKVWQDAHVLTLPGKYLTMPSDGPDPGSTYLRLALVASPDVTEVALRRIADVLD